MLNLTERTQKKMEVAKYHWECHQVREYQPAYDIKEFSTDKMRNEKENVERMETVGTNKKSKHHSHH